MKLMTSPLNANVPHPNREVEHSSIQFAKNLKNWIAPYTESCKILEGIKGKQNQISPESVGGTKT
jgi:hypothetical protein